MYSIESLHVLFPYINSMTTEVSTELSTELST